MTDILLESKDGSRMHFFKDDNVLKVVYIRENGVVVVRRLPRHLLKQLEGFLDALEVC